jgi:hypothetical protein
MAAARVFKVEFRTAVAQRILNGESVSSLSRQYKIKRFIAGEMRIAKWERLVLAGPGGPGRAPNGTPLLNHRQQRTKESWS